jgi:hypothetical protein
MNMESFSGDVILSMISSNIFSSDQHVFDTHTNWVPTLVGRRLRSSVSICVLLQPFSHDS